MPSNNHDDLDRIHEIGNDAPLLWQQFRTWYGSVFADGALSRREKALAALAVAHALQCPYSIEAYSEECAENGYDLAQMTEAVHVAAALRGGSSLMHSLQMRDCVGEES